MARKFRVLVDGVLESTFDKYGDALMHVIESGERKYGVPKGWDMVPYPCRDFMRFTLKKGELRVERTNGTFHDKEGRCWAIQD